jgi:Secretion system C-terminal sorting domain
MLVTISAPEPGALVARSYNPNDYTTTATLLDIAIPMPLTKGECPSSLVNTQELNPASVTVFPNPSYGDFTIDAGEALILKVEVFDITERLVLKISNPASNTPLSIKGAGAYFLNIETDKGRVLKKVVRID